MFTKLKVEVSKQTEDLFNMSIYKKTQKGDRIKENNKGYKWLL